MSSPEASSSGRLPVRKLGIVLLVLALAVGAGCTGVLDDGGGDGGDATLVENVPEDQNVLIEVDMDLLSDDTTQRLLEEGGEEDEEAPSEAEMEAAFSYVEAETGLDPRDVDSVLVYGQTEDVDQSAVDDPADAADADDQVGILVSTDWSQADIAGAFENDTGSALTEVSYDAQDGVLYRVSEGESDDDPVYLGALGDGAFVLGDETSVRASLDTEYDGAASLSGDLRDAYDNTRDGHVSAAMLFPEEDRQTQLGEMRAMTGVYYTDGDTIGLEGRLVTDSSESAGDMKDSIDILLATMGDDPEMQQLMENLDISQDGSDVTFTYESDVETLLENADSA